MSKELATTAMQLSDYFLMLRRHWRVILGGVVLGAVVAAGFLALAPREYTSATSVLVSASTGANATAGRPLEINLDTEAQLVTSTETVAAAAGLLDVTLEDNRELAERVTVTVPPNTEILTISFVGPTAEDAKAGAKAFAEAYLDGRRASAEAVLDAEYEALQQRIDEVRAQLDQVTESAAGMPAGSAERARADAQAAALNNQLAGLGSQQNQIRASAVSPGRIVTQAGLPSAPSSPSIPLTGLAGVVGGLLLGIGLAALRYRADDRLRSVSDLERRTEIPVAAALPTALRDGGVTVVQPSSADSRAYARLRNLVTSNLERSSRRVVLVTSTHRGGDAVAVNLAASLARGGEDVCLVSADAFGDTALALLGRAPSSGLADLLSGDKQLTDVLQPVPDLPALRVVGPGSDPDRADALLQTRGTRTVIDRLLESFAYVVIEAPATSEGTVAQTLATAAELALLVVETDHTSAREVRDAQGQFESMHRPVLGTVVVSYVRGSAGGRSKKSKRSADGRGTVPSGATSAALRADAVGAANGKSTNLSPAGSGAAPR